MSVKMKGESENLVFRVDSLDYDLSIAQVYRLQTYAVTHFKCKFKIGVGKIYAGRLGMCVGPNCNSRSKIDVSAIFQRINVVAPLFHQVCTL